MVIEIEDAEPKKPASDLVNEARELLNRLKNWPSNGVDIKHALFADAVERERDSPFFGCSTPVADLYSRAPDLLSQLCNELDQQTSRIATQAESLSTWNLRLRKGVSCSRCRAHPDGS